MTLIWLMNADLKHKNKSAQIRPICVIRVRFLDCLFTKKARTVGMSGPMFYM